MVCQFLLPLVSIVLAQSSPVPPTPPLLPISIQEMEGKVGESRQTEMGTDGGWHCHAALLFMPTASSRDILRAQEAVYSLRNPSKASRVPLSTLKVCI